MIALCEERQRSDADVTPSYGEDTLEQFFERELLRAEYPHHVWAIDFQFDQTMDGRTLKFLNVIDEYSRLCLAIRVGRRCRAAEVIDTIEELLKLYPPPTHLRMDNGP